MLLAIDTATYIMSLALHDGRTLLAEQTWHSANHHTVQLAPALRNLMTDCNVTLEDLTALAVSIGPGSYTGLRIGVALAKGLAVAHNLPLVGITTLDTLAAAQPHYSAGSLIAMIQAGRGQIIVGRYQWRKSAWVSRGDPQLMSWEAFLANLDGPAYLTGEISEQGLELIAKASPGTPLLTLVPAAFRLRRAGFLAQCAWERLKAGDSADFTAAKLAPIYLRT